jgi:integrase
VLTNLEIKNAKPGRHHDGNNLILAVYRSGARCWVLRYRDKITGKRHELGLGGWPRVSGAEARKKATEAQALRNDNRSPKTVWAEERRIANLPTFEEAADLYFNVKGANWNPRHLADTKAKLAARCPSFAGKLVTSVEAADIQKDILAYHKEAPVAALRMRNTVEQVIAYAQFLKHIPEGTPNPARWEGHMENILGELSRAAVKDKKGQPSMPYAQVPEFLATVRSMWLVDGKYNVPALALAFLILNGNRSAEVLEATWAEINADSTEWTIPARRMKDKKTRPADRPHIVPLTETSREILTIMRGLRCGPYVFPGTKPNKPPTEKSLQRLMGKLAPEFVPHGFRASLRNWAGNEAHAEYEICEMAISHRVGSAVGKAYWTKHPVAKHRALLEAWHGYLNATPTANVVTLRSVRSA